MKDYYQCAEHEGQDECQGKSLGLQVKKQTNKQTPRVGSPYKLWVGLRYASIGLVFHEKMLGRARALHDGFTPGFLLVGPWKGGSR